MISKRVFWKVSGCFLLFFLLMSMNACDLLDICGGYGFLELTNDSNNTYQKIVIDGANYGTLAPGESETFELTVGRHSVARINIRTGNYACTPFEVTIVECDTQAFSCSG
jgi:hypothetical protein